MDLVPVKESGSLEVFNPGVRDILSTFQESAAMTKAEGQELEAAFERYQTETQTLIASMYAENLKYQLALAEALQRETATTLIHTKTVETLQERVNSLEGALKETREAMLRETEKAKVQMAELTKSHATAMQTALAACRAQAASDQVVAVTAVQTRAQQRLSAAAWAVSTLNSGLHSDIQWYTAANASQLAQWPGKRQAEYTQAKIPPILQQIQAPF